mmetsp:Transcript_106615/g.344013  ORF Transcript_106615/g.344013 Transcript_106615/m.344013 type:complete len:429 (+) Transcript_106615:83-1369(+)
MPRTGLRLLATASLLAPWQARADLGAALRRQVARAESLDLPGAAPPSGPVVVRLRRVEARRVPGRPVHSGEAFYVGNVSVGQPPQQLEVLFDTASGHLLLPHRACKSRACREHRRYSPWESSTAVDVNPDGGAVQKGARLARGPVMRTVVTVGFTQADLGDGNARGVLVRDDVCLGSATGRGQACASLAVLAALNMDDEPFSAMPHDGILGLALEGLAAGALSSFYERLMDHSHQLLPQFGLSLGAEGGEICFGGHDRSRLAAPLRWFAVERPGEGFWQVRIHAVRVGNATVDACQAGCRGIIDTGSSSLGTQADRVQRLLPRLRSAPAPGGGCQGPDLELDLGGFSLALTAGDYSDAACEPELGTLGLEKPEFTGVYALGTSVLRHYYTVFDWAAARVGFAPAAGAAPAGALGVARQAPPAREMFVF